MPEKNSGQVNTIAVPSLPTGVEGSPPDFAIHHPAARLDNSPFE
jgi:hypothetical protein